MKKLFAALISASCLLAPLAMASEASAAEHYRRPPAAEKKVVVTRYTWTRGHRLTPAERRHIAEVRDYRRYKLSAPPRGYRWVRADNRYLLIGINTGMISTVVIAR